MAPGQWVEVAFIAGRSAPVQLRAPGLVASDRSRVYVYDYEARRLFAFALDGTMLWHLANDAAGRPFRNPTSLSADISGKVWLLDHPSATVHAIASGGQIAGSFRVPTTAWRMVPAEGGMLLAWGDGPSGGEVLRLNDRGRVQGVLPSAAASAALDALPSLVRESFVASSWRGRVVEAYRWSDQIRMWSSPTSWKLASGPGDLSFPKTLTWTVGNEPVERVDPRAVARTRGVTADDSLAYVLRRAPGRSSGRIIDVYRFDSATYTYSIELPEPVVALTRMQDGFVGVTTKPSARLRHWRWTPERLPRRRLSGSRRTGAASRE